MKLVFFVCIALIFSGLPTRPIHDKLEDISEFYFPYTTLAIPQIYQYTNQEDPEDVSYAYLSSYEKENIFYLTTTTYSANGKKKERVTKKITTRGPIIVEYAIFAYDNFGNSMEVPCFIESSEVLHWECRPGDKVKWKINYPLPGKPSCNLSLIKNREYINQTEVKVYKNRSYRSCRFFDTLQIQEACNSSGVAWAPSKFFWQNYYYAEGLGLIQYQSTDSHGLKKTFNLTDVMSESKWLTHLRGKK